MSAIDVTALGLASHVALGWTDIGPTGGCVAWVESRADECGRPRTDGQLLCPRHVTVARRRQDAERAREVQRRNEAAERRYRRRSEGDQS